jgi:hypothetical protein
MADAEAGGEPIGFRGTVLLAGKTATGVVVPDVVVAALGAGKRPPVRVVIGDHAYRSTVAVMGGKFMLPISAEVRAAAGVAAGDEIEIGLVLDGEPRVVAVPHDLAAALAGDTGAERCFEGLSYSNRRRIVLSIDGAKTAETRQRRIDKALAALHEGRAL